jgi:hypothetical protein
MFKRVVQSLKRSMTGTVVARFDSPAHGGFTQLSLRVKESCQERFVMLVVKSPGHSHFVDLSQDEFRQLAAAVDQVRTTLAQPSLLP